MCVCVNVSVRANWFVCVRLTAKVQQRESLQSLQLVRERGSNGIADGFTWFT